MRLRLTILLGALFLAAACGSDSGSYYIYEVKITNTSTSSSFLDQNGVPVPIAFSSIVWAIHSDGEPIFKLGQVASDPGLRQLAEDGDPIPLANALQEASGVKLVGIQTQTEENSAILRSGETYRFLISAEKGKRFSFASSFLQGNDNFIAFKEEGIPLFNETGEQLSGDLTSEVLLYDAGTEVDEAPGLGANQAPRQTEAGDGARQNGTVSQPANSFNYPDISQVLRFEITPREKVDN